jgi:hypothetical protein
LVDIVDISGDFHLNAPHETKKERKLTYPDLWTDSCLRLKRLRLKE